MEILKGFLFVFGFVFVCSALTFLVIYGLLYTGNTVKNNSIKLKFSAFKHLYYISPNSWEFPYDPESNVVFYHYSTYERGVACYFGCFDYLRYRFFRNKLREDKRLEKQRELLQKCISGWKKDIKRFKEEEEDSVNLILKKWR